MASLLAQRAVLDHPPGGAPAPARIARPADLGHRRGGRPDRRDRHPRPGRGQRPCARSRSTAPTASTGTEVVRVVEALDDVKVIEVTDRTFELHRGGKIYTGLKVPLQDPRRPVDGLHARRRARLQRDRGRPATRRSSTRSRRTRSPSSPTGRRCSASATSAPRRPCPSWRARRCCSRSSPTSTRSRSASTPRTPTRSSRRSS